MCCQYNFVLLRGDYFCVMLCAVGGDLLYFILCCVMLCAVGGDLLYFISAV
jgi:hypothetical protein